MDRNEKLQYEQGIESYFDEHKVYDLFEKLFKELIVNRPEEPIDYLIERLKRKETQRIFITGYPGTNGKDVGLAVGEALEITCLSVGDLLERIITGKMDNAPEIEKNFQLNTAVDDEIVIELVRKELISYEEKNVSYIIEGFPRNRTQAIFLQSVGLLPDNIIILKTTRENAEERVANKLKEREFAHDKSEEEIKQLAKNSIDEAELNIRAVEDVYKGFFCEFPVNKFESKEEVKKELARLLKFKAKTNANRRPPRIILAAPPSSGKIAIAERLAKKLQIIHVNIRDLLLKEINLKNENSQIILDALNANEPVPDKFILKLLEDRLFCSDCLINGWIVTGFPYSQSQINYMENMKPALKPSLLVVIDMDERIIKEKASKIRFNPETSRFVRIGSKKVADLTEEEMNKLIPREQDGEERLAKRIEVWKNVSEILLQKNCLKLNGEDKKKMICQFIEDAIGYNS